MWPVVLPEVLTEAVLEAQTLVLANIAFFPFSSDPNSQKKIARLSGEALELREAGQVRQAAFHQQVT